MPTMGLGLSFVLSLLISLVYTRLNRGVPNTRAFSQTLAVAGVVSAMIVLAVGDNVARGLGLVGALTVIRFRTNLKDPRDLIFAFAALGCGVAAGALAFVVAVLGTLVFLGAMLLVSRPWFAETDTFDAILTLRSSGSPADMDKISVVLRSECQEFALVRVRQLGRALQEHAYQVRLKRPNRQSALVQAIEHLDGIEGALLVAYEGSADA